MCGAMAGDAMAAPVLLGLGLDEFSMSATQILQARKIINNMKYSDAQALAAKCVDQETMEEVQAIIKEALA
jgi:phosphotransferase system enzyme I (PtsI)